VLVNPRVEADGKIVVTVNANKGRDAKLSRIGWVAGHESRLHL
jgi:hypothetical protein